MANQETLDALVAKKAEGGLTTQEKADIAKHAKKLPDVNVNLAYARTAVNVVLQRIKHVANWDERLGFSAEATWTTALERAEAKALADGKKAKSQAEANAVNHRFREEIAQARRASENAWNAADRCVYGNLRSDAEWQRINSQVGGVEGLFDIQILSNLAEKHSCGNCGELTSLAFMYLHGLGVRPLDFMILQSPADHAFVVIGRKGSQDDDDRGTNWGKSAVVCDPWAHGLYKALAPDVHGPPATFGYHYSAYAASLLNQRMTAMHSTFQGVQFPKYRAA